MHEEEEIIPTLMVRGKNLELAKLLNLTNVGTELEATVKLKVKEIRRNDKIPLDARHEEYANSSEFEVVELYVSSVKDDEPAESDQDKFERGLIGAPMKPKPKPPTAAEALGPNY